MPDLVMRSEADIVAPVSGKPDLSVVMNWAYWGLPRSGGPCSFELSSHKPLVLMRFIHIWGSEKSWTTGPRDFSSATRLRQRLRRVDCQSAEALAKADKAPSSKAPHASTASRPVLYSHSEWYSEGWKN